MARRLATAEKLWSRLVDQLEANPPDHAGAAATIVAALALPEAAEQFDVPQLLEELAECYAQLGRFADAIAAMERAIANGWRGTPDGRVHIAGLHLRAGQAEAARTLYAQVRVDTPDDVWLYNAVGMDYADAGDHRQALQWLTDGLDLALRTDDPEELVDQLADLRRECLDALGLPPDVLQARAVQFLATHLPMQGDDEPGPGDEPDEPDRFPPPPAAVRTVVDWFPRDQFDRAVQLWPHLTESWDATTYAGYCQMLQAGLLRFARSGIHPLVAPIQIDAYRRYCSQAGLDPAGPDSRSRYAAELGRQGQGLAWPPERNAPCWCGSGRKYKKCCGTVELPPDAAGAAPPTP